MGHRESPGTGPRLCMTDMQTARWHTANAPLAPRHLGHKPPNPHPPTCATWEQAPGDPVDPARREARVPLIRPAERLDRLRWRGYQRCGAPEMVEIVRYCAWEMPPELRSSQLSRSFPG